MPSERQLEMQPRRHVLEVFAEALNDGDGVAWHRVVGRPCAQAGQGKGGKDDYSARTAARHKLLEPILTLSNKRFKIGSLFGAASVIPPWHGNTLSDARSRSLS